jgi:hypothetical protein
LFAVPEDMLALMNIRSSFQLVPMVTTVAVLWSWPSRAWDSEVHFFVTDLAVECLPADFPDFVREQGTRQRICFLSAEPDRWRNIKDVELRHAQGPEHYLDIEELQTYGMDPDKLPALRYDFIAGLALRRQAEPEKFEGILRSPNEDSTRQIPGLLPWVMTESLLKLKSCFSYLGTYKQHGRSEGDVANAQQNTVYVMGVMSHYFADAFQPLHTTIHHHGWVGENPHGYTTNARFHSWIDSGFFRSAGLPSKKDLVSKLRPARRLAVEGRRLDGEACFRRFVDLLVEQNKQVEGLYRMEKAGKFSPHGDVQLLGRAYLEDQLVKSSQALADAWLTAFSEAPPDKQLKAELRKQELPTESKRAGALRGAEHGN